jgi:molybdopterin-binding protein
LNVYNNLAVVGNTTSYNGYVVKSFVFNAQTGAYTLASGDDGRIITIDSASPVNLTVGTAVNIVGFSCTVIQLGTGQVTIVASSTTLNSYNGLKLIGQHAAATIVCYAASTFNVAGNLTA